MKLAPLWISFLLLICLFACAQVQDDGARSLHNANTVISPTGQKLWTGGPNGTSQNGTAPNGTGTPTERRHDEEPGK